MSRSDNFQLKVWCRSLKACQLLSLTGYFVNTSKQVVTSLIYGVGMPFKTLFIGELMSLLKDDQGISTTSQRAFKELNTIMMIHHG